MSKALTDTCGGAVVLGDGREVPITEEMIRQALLALEPELAQTAAARAQG